MGEEGVRNQESGVREEKEEKEEKKRVEKTLTPTLSRGERE